MPRVTLSQPGGLRFEHQSKPGAGNRFPEMVQKGPGRFDDGQRGNGASCVVLRGGKIVLPLAARELFAFIEHAAAEF